MSHDCKRSPCRMQGRINSDSNDDTEPFPCPRTYCKSASQISEEGGFGVNLIPCFLFLYQNSLVLLPFPLLCFWRIGPYVVFVCWAGLFGPLDRVKVTRLAHFYA